MPVITYLPPDPTDLVIQGESMRASVRDEVVNQPILLAGSQIPAGFFSLVPDDDAYPPMNTMIEGSRLSMRRMSNGQLQIRSGAGIATPCGAWIWNDWLPLLNPRFGPTTGWVITGITRDSTGATLGNCRVVALEVGRIEVSNAPVVAETISDGSGNYSLTVPMNVAYWVVAYKPGSPDVGGVSLNTVVPVAA